MADSDLDGPSDVRLVRLEPDAVSDAVALLEAGGLPTDDLRDTGVFLFRGVHDGRTVGFGGLEPFGETVLFRSIVVAADERGRGYGTAICRALEDEARRRDGEWAYLLTTDAAGFFGRLGFERCDRGDAPADVRRSRQFADLCPSAAACMRKALADD